MEHLKEYRFFKATPWKSNVKDENEPFFNVPKYDYKRKKRILGNDFTGDKNRKLIKINSEVIENILKSRPGFISTGLSDKVDYVLQEIKKVANFMDKYPAHGGEGVFGDDSQLDNYIVVTDLLDDDVRVLYNLGFGIKIYDDSNEYSDYFGDKYKIMWEWK